MKKFLSLFTVFAILLTLSAAASTEMNFGVANKAEVAGLTTNLKGAITFDIMTNSVMYSQEVDTPIAVSGYLVRLMAALTAENEKRNGNYSNTEMTEAEYEKLIAGALVEERDEDMRKLALYFAEDVNDFVLKMNTLAVRIGMTSSRFTNITGASDASAQTTVRDLALLTKELYTDSTLYSYLRSNMYRSMDGQMTFSRKTQYAVLNKDDQNYNERLNFFAAAADGDKSLTVCTVSKDSSSREVICIMYHSGGRAANYVSSYHLDLLKLQTNAYTAYYQTDLYSIGKSIAKNTVFKLADNTTVYVTVEVPSDEQSTKLFPSKYGSQLAYSEKDCYLEINEGQLPESAELGEVIASGKLKFGNDVLMNVLLRASKIQMQNGTVRSEDYVLYSIEDGAEQAEHQYKKNDWILAVGLVCGIALVAVVAAEVAKRKIIL